MKYLLSLTFITLLLFPSLSFGFDQSDLDRLKATNECVGCELSGADLSGANLRGANLGGADLSFAILIGSDLKGANLKGSNLKGSNLSGADLSETYLVEANLSGANLSEANLSEANLRDANLFGANLNDANLFGINLHRANLEEANLNKANLNRANLNKANLKGSDLSGANLNGARLDKVNLTGANLSGVNLTGAYLYGANLTGANLEGVNLANIKNPPKIIINELKRRKAEEARKVEEKRKATIKENLKKLTTTNECENCDLTGVDLQGANLKGANLKGAKLIVANLSSANLVGANLTEANLKAADLQGAIFTGANLEGANLEGANLSEANLEGADLNQVNLEKTNLKWENLKYINLKYIKNPPKIIIDKLKKIRIENANTYNETCHMHTCYWFRVREVRDSRFPNDPVIGWHPQKRVADQQLKNPFYILRKNPFVVEFLTSWATTSHVCSNRDSDKLISCANFGPYNDEYPSNWEEDYPSTLDEFTYKFQKYIKWKKSSTYFHCSKQFPAIAYNILEEEVREIKVFQFQDWHHKNFKSALYFHFCHNKIVNSLNYISSVDFDYPSLAKELGYPQYVYNAQLPAPTFPSWDALVNFNK